MNSLRYLLLGLAVFGGTCGLLALAHPAQAAIALPQPRTTPQPQPPRKIVFDVYVQVPAEAGESGWAFCRRHADYAAALKDVNFLSSRGYVAVLLPRE